MNVYENILEEARKQGKTIRQVEQESDLTNGSIGKWRNSNPQVNRLKKVAEVLKVPLEELIK